MCRVVDSGYRMVIVVFYDLNLVVCYCDCLVLLYEGGVYVEGLFLEVFILDVLECVYGFCVWVFSDDGIFVVCLVVIV